MVQEGEDPFDTVFGGAANSAAEEEEHGTGDQMARREVSREVVEERNVVLCEDVLPVGIRLERAGADSPTLARGEIGPSEVQVEMKARMEDHCSGFEERILSY
jgi:hypothetical protein